MVLKINQAAVSILNKVSALLVVRRVKLYVPKSYLLPQMGARISAVFMGMNVKKSA